MPLAGIELQQIFVATQPSNTAAGIKKLIITMDLLRMKANAFHDIMSFDFTPYSRKQ